MSDTTRNELKSAERKLLANERAKFRLQQRFDRIDHEVDVVLPKIVELRAKAAQGELPTIAIGGDSPPDGDQSRHEARIWNARVRRRSV